MVAELTTRPAVAPAPDSHAVPGLIDALTPPDMARKAVEMGISKITLDVRTSFLLSILAGAFIAIGAIFSLTVTAALNRSLIGRFSDTNQTQSGQRSDRCPRPFSLAISLTVMAALG